jgi:hypothetical protein
MFQGVQVLVHNPSDIIQKILFPFLPPIGSFISHLYLHVPVHLFIVQCYYNSYTPSYLPYLFFTLSRSVIPLLSFPYPLHTFISPLISSLLVSHPVYLSVAPSFFSSFSSNDRWAFGDFPAFRDLFLGNGILIWACFHFLHECKFDIWLSLSNILVIRQKD